MTEVINSSAVAIEYPRHNEKITSSTYTFRVAAPHDVKNAEVSIDGAGWEPCRRSGESWWYDWSGYGSGKHEIAARMETMDGRFETAEPRFITVEAQSPMGRADKRMTTKFVVMLRNQPEVLNRLTRLMSQEDVNIDSLLVETFGDVASVRFLLEKENGLRKTLENEGFHVTDDKVFRLTLPNRPGEIDQLTRKLAESGIGVRYLYGTSHGLSTNVIFSVDRPEDAVGLVKELDQRAVALEA